MSNPILTANGTTLIPLLSGRVYTLAAGGTFGGGTINAELLLDDGTPVPLEGFPITTPANLHIPATTASLRLTLSGATAPSITYAVNLTQGSTPTAIGAETPAGAQAKADAAQAAALAADSAKANLNGGNTITGTQTFTGQLSLTSQTAQAASSAVTVGMTRILPPALRGEAYDEVIGGLCSTWVHHTPYAFVPDFWAHIFGGVMFANKPPGNNFTTANITLLNQRAGYSPACPRTGAVRSNAVGLSFLIFGAPASVEVRPTLPYPFKIDTVMRVWIPSKANRAGRRHYICTAPFYQDLPQFNHLAYASLFFDSTTNSLQWEVVTNAAAPSPGAFSAPATTAAGFPSGTFTPYALPNDAAHELLIYQTKSTITGLKSIAIASYSATPAFTTIVQNNASWMDVMLGVTSDGTGAGNDTQDSAPRLISAHQGIKF